MRWIRVSANSPAFLSQEHLRLDKVLPEGEGGWPGNLPCPRRAGCNSVMLWSSRSKASCFAEGDLVCYEYNAMLLTVLEMCLLPNTRSAMLSLSVVSGHPLSVSSEATGCLSNSVGRGRSSGPDPEIQTRRGLTLSPPGPLPLLLRAWAPPWLRTSVDTQYLTVCVSGPGRFASDNSNSD